MFYVLIFGLPDGSTRYKLNNVKKICNMSLLFHYTFCFLCLQALAVLFLELNMLKTKHFLENNFLTIIYLVWLKPSTC